MSRFTIAAIQQAVARECDLTVAQLKEDTRRREIVYARSLAMYLCRQLIRPVPTYSLIGRGFGFKHPSTVMHAERKIKRLLGEARISEKP